MKKVSQYGFATGSILILIGLIWSGFSWHRIDNDIQRIGRIDYTTKQMTFASDSVQSIRVNTRNISVDIKTQADTSHVRISYAESKLDKYAISSSNGTVSVSRVATAGGITNNFCIFHCMGSPIAVTIYVPTNSSYSYNLTSDNGPVLFKNSGTLKTGAIQVKSSNSIVQLQHLSVGGAVSLTSDNGGIEMESVTSSAKINLGSSNARNVLTHVSAPSIVSKTNNGGAMFRLVTVKDISVNTSNATITLDHLVADHIAMTSDNGGITGTIIGSKDDYASKVTVDNGDIRVNGTKYGDLYLTDTSKNGRTLTAKASNASATLNFVQ